MTEHFETLEVFRKLQDFSAVFGDGLAVDSRDGGMIRCDIDSKLKAGWTSQEVYELLRNMEEVNPHISEELALSRMAAIHKQVAARLKG